jgi:hypothetical protein
METQMNLEPVSRPVDAFREQVLRVGSNVVSRSRRLGATALRTSAEKLVVTAQRLNGLAEQLEAEPVATEGAATEGASPASEASIASEATVSSGTVLDTAEPPDSEPTRAEEVAAKKRAARR